MVHSQLWYRVGSSYEPAGQSGLSHALAVALEVMADQMSTAQLDDIKQYLPRALPEVIAPDPILANICMSAIS